MLEAWAWASSLVIQQGRINPELQLPNALREQCIGQLLNTANAHLCGSAMLEAWAWASSLVVQQGRLNPELQLPNALREQCIEQLLNTADAQLCA
jgi:hypothetical protein